MYLLNLITTRHHLLLSTSKDLIGFNKIFCTSCQLSEGPYFHLFPKFHKPTILSQLSLLSTHFRSKESFNVVRVEHCVSCYYVLIPRLFLNWSRKELFCFFRPNFECTGLETKCTRNTVKSNKQMNILSSLREAAAILTSKFGIF